jgi:hypothetical protein
MSILVPRFYVFITICYVHFFLLALMDSAWSQVFKTRVICDIGCPGGAGEDTQCLGV